ncbi:DUF2293 domain-containing protein [Rhizobium leguminosarum]|uniref:DUF2293 domain-containing protein n=1 Tax=Rhizobium leguminosarum TaxID=384 RepID=UPI001DE56A7C|nr:hypothetical protein [Rhizobium leguminosarum]
MKTRAERRRERRKQWFVQAEVEDFIRQEYPACPEFAVVYFATRICTVPKNWRSAPISEAVDVTMQNMLRHQLTDYDQLMLIGVRRKEARRRVQPKVNAIIDGWKKQRPEMVAQPVEKRMDPREFAAELLITDKVIMDRLAK